MVNNEQIAHDLAMVYLGNRHGAEVEGEFEVSTSGDDVTGSGEVWTERLPEVDSTRKKRVGTGERHLLGLREKKKWIDTGEYEVDEHFQEMIKDYYAAYSRFLELLARRARESPAE